MRPWLEGQFRRALISSDRLVHLSQPALQDWSATQPHTSASAAVPGPKKRLKLFILFFFYILEKLIDIVAARHFRVESRLTPVVMILDAPLAFVFLELQREIWKDFSCLIFKFIKFPPLSHSQRERSHVPWGSLQKIVISPVSTFWLPPMLYLNKIQIWKIFEDFFSFFEIKKNFRVIWPKYSSRI